jgi:hypothetical protein
MRTTRTTRRKRQATRLPAQRGVNLAAVAADMPRCVSCGEPLVRLPRFLLSAQGAGHGFQCQRCFYANAGPAPKAGETIASDRTRWLTEALSEPGEAPPPTPRNTEA